MPTNPKKLLLAAIRNGNYAHPGEEAAIEMAMQLIPKQTSQTLLDVGCGLGGTANYIQDQGWGNVTAIDIAPDMIEYVQKTYPHLRSFCSDVENLDTKISGQFDIIYMFNAFFCFPNQGNALDVLSRFAHNDTKLLIFD